MTRDEFEATLDHLTPPTDAHPMLKALWHDAKGDWAAAHSIAQNGEGSVEYDRLHAYLHRKEGDESNAEYWYRRAKSGVFSGSLEDEWSELVGRYLK